MFIPHFVELHAHVCVLVLMEVILVMLKYVSLCVKCYGFANEILISISCVIGPMEHIHLAYIVE